MCGSCGSSAPIVSYYPSDVLEYTVLPSSHTTADLDVRYDLLKQQLPDHKMDRHAEGRYVITSRETKTFHSDSSNPQHEHSLDMNLYDLLEFEGGSLFKAKLHKSWSMWRSRGGSSGFHGSIDWGSDEVTAFMEAPLLCLVTHVSPSSGLRVLFPDTSHIWIDWKEFCPLNMEKTVIVFRVDKSLWKGEDWSEENDDEVIVGEGWAKKVVAMKK